jgi:peptidoglycan/LPS O-acetylase OafA/YrhL
VNLAAPGLDQHSKYRADVDGLRAVAVAAVVFFHLTPTLLPGGFLGVDVFFVISGYLISGIILDDIRRRRFSLATFYLRRARRILPALLVMFAGVVPLAALVLMPDELERFGRSLTASSLFVPNFALWREAGYFDAESGAKPFLHLWSLGVEEQFYLLWPMLLVLLVRMLRLRGLVIAIALLACASLAWQAWVSRSSPAAAFFLPFGRIWELMIGALLALWGRLATSPPFANWKRPALDALSVIGFLMVCIPIVSWRRHGNLPLPVMLAPTLGAAMIIAAGSSAWVSRALLSKRPVVYVGLISYPLYLWHWPLLSFLRISDLEGPQLERALRVMALIVAVAASVVTYKFVELPVRRRQDLSPLGVRLGSGLAAAAAAGIALTLSHGWPQRTGLATNPFVVTPAMRFQQRCLDLYLPRQVNTDLFFCQRSDYSRTPAVLLLGDSHANALWPGVLDGFPHDSLLQLGSSACPYLREAYFSPEDSAGHLEACREVATQAYQAVSTARVVILSARGTLYTSPAEERRREFDPIDRGQFVSPKFPGATPMEVFEKSLERDLDFLLQGQREVVIVQPVPELDFSPRRCVAMRPFEVLLELRPAAACSVSRADMEARQARFRAMMARVVAKISSPRLHVVDPSDVLCDASRCHAVLDGILLYRDDDHLTAQGARYVWSRISPFGREPVISPASETGASADAPGAQTASPP